MGQIPVERGTGDAAALDAAAEALRRGECVHVFPEGTISADLDPMAGKTGLARLARAAGVDVHDRRAVGDAAGDPAPGPEGGTVPHTDHHGRGGDRRRRPRRQPPGDDRPHHGRHLRRRRRRQAALPEAAGCRAAGEAVVVPPTGIGPARASCRGRVAQAKLTRRRSRGPALMRLAVIGAGSWGTTVAALGARNAAHVSLWARRPEAGRGDRASGENADYLPGLPLDARGGHRPARGGARRRRRRGPGRAVARVPVGAGRGGAVRAGVGGRPQPGQGPRAGLAQADDRGGGRGAAGPGRGRIGVLTGPNIASEVAAGLPTASVVAMADSDGGGGRSSGCS